MSIVALPDSLAHEQCEPLRLRAYLLTNCSLINALVCWLLYPFFFLFYVILLVYILVILMAILGASVYPECRDILS